MAELSKYGFRIHLSCLKFDVYSERCRTIIVQGVNSLQSKFNLGLFEVFLMRKLKK